MATAYTYSVTANAELRNKTNETSMRAELHFEEFRTYAPTEDIFELRYEDGIIELAKSFVQPAQKDLFDFTGLGFESKRSIDVPFTRTQIDTVGKVSIKRVNVRGKYYVRFSDNSGTFKRVRWKGKNRDIERLRREFREAQSQNRTQTGFLPKSVRDDYVFVMEKDDDTVFKKEGTYDHET